jgi:hypothetical protein
MNVPTITKNKKYNSSGLAGLPVQTVSMWEKELPDWQEACMDFFDYTSGAQQIA